MKILVVWTGALACLYAARLASAGDWVVMLGSWPAGVDALRKNGVRLQELDGTQVACPVEVLEYNETQGSFSHALVLVKAWQTQKAAHQLMSCLSLDGIALTLQNGAGNVEILKESLGAERVVLGVTTEGAMLVEPGCARHTGQGKVIIGAHPKTAALKRLFSKAGFKVEIVADAESALWGKLVINAAINPLTALLRVPNGELLARPSARQLMAEAAQEAARVANQRGIRLPYHDPVAAVEEVARNTATNNSSMLQDVLRGTPTEIDAINGAIVQAGEELGISTPVNRLLWNLVKAIDHH